MATVAVAMDAVMEVAVMVVAVLMAVVVMAVDLHTEPVVLVPIKVAATVCQPAGSTTPAELAKEKTQ